VTSRPPGRGHVEGRIGWLEKTVGEIAGGIERAVFNERLARSRGWLQRRDPRAKLAGSLVLILAASLTTSLVGLGVLYAALLGAAWASRVPFGLFVKRVWLGIPLFAGVIALPAVFFVPGDRVFELAIGPLWIAPSWPGVQGAILLVSRVGVSVSAAVLLVLTTPWADLLKSLRALRVPQVFVVILSMTYRYVFLFLHSANGMLLARRSRVVGRATRRDQWRWGTGTMGTLMGRAFKMSSDVYSAMLARGFTGEVRLYTVFRMRSPDWALVAVAAVVAAAGLAAGWRIA
jgi:cobalt/nickel transport system permease protein